MHARIPYPLAGFEPHFKGMSYKVCSAWLTQIGRNLTHASRPLLTQSGHRGPVLEEQKSSLTSDETVNVGYTSTEQLSENPATVHFSIVARFLR